MHYRSIGLGRLCRLFGKTRQAVYEQSWHQSNQKMQEGLVLDAVRQVRTVLSKTGTLKLHHMIKDQLLLHGVTIGRDSLYKLLGKYNLLIKQSKKYVRTTQSYHHYYKWPDLTPDILPDAASQLWVSDITYLRTTSGFIYLSLVTDAYSRKIVGYHLSQHLKAQSCLIALNKAITALKVEHSNLVHHSDRGIQYCCDLYVTTLQENKIQISMTQNGSPYENAIAERVNGILKTELGLDRVFTCYANAIEPTYKAIDAYNRLRLHMSCGYLTPEKAHLKQGKLNKVWKIKKQSVKPF
jgi:transposase InsO family protein